MPSIRYVNQTAPFWDFVASIENQDNPFFAAHRREEREESGEENAWAGPWGPWGHRGWHRGPHRGPHHHRPGPPPPPGTEGNFPPHPPPEYESGPAQPGNQEKPSEPEQAGPSNTRPTEDQPHQNRCHGRRGGRAFGRGGPCGGRPPFFPMMGGPFNMNNLAEYIQSQIFGHENEEGVQAANDFKPEADVFDTEASYVVHLSLPGAKKEDIGVNWDAEKSELSIAGVVYRPGDEEFLKTLALDERKVGPFERKIRLGSRANPAQIDVDAITAKLEDGILRVEVPKLDKDYVEIKKVDIE